MAHPTSDESRDKWNGKYSEAAGVPNHPSQVLVALHDMLPTTGRAVDVAGGAGRNAIWLAQQGLDVTLTDISTNGLRLAAQRARSVGVPLRTLEADLEQDDFPPGPWNLVFIHLFLWRPILAAAKRELADDGKLIMIQPSKSNLQRHAKPPADFLLEDGELPKLAEQAGLRVVMCREGWDADGRHDAVLVAEKQIPDPTQ